MAAAHLTEDDTKRAKQLWDDYVAEHDLSGKKGSVAGIDPNTGEVWFGDSAADIAQRLIDDAIFRPLFFVRVGSPTYLRKVGRRTSPRNHSAFLNGYGPEDEGLYDDSSAG